MTTLDRQSYVLVIEDAPDQRDAVRLILELDGYDAVAVASGEDALQHLRDNELPSMILLDLMMHGTSGWDFRAAQLSDARLAMIPVVVCSGDGRLDEKARALRVVEQLAKPIEPKTLLAMVALHCDRQARPSAARAIRESGPASRDA